MFDKSLSDLEKNNLGAIYVGTFRTESAKSCILTSARGYRTEEYPNGIDVDESQYLSSLIPSERGFVWSISDTYYGNPDKDRNAITEFRNEIDRFPGLLDIALGIEGCISGRGRHASGVLLLDNDPYEYCAFMKTPAGEIITQYDLHTQELLGGVKVDLLVTEIQDKIIETINLLQQDGVIDPNLKLREVYNKYLHPDVLPLDDKESWAAIQRADVLDLFQFDSPIGRQGAKKVKPNNMIELSTTNALIRLMSTEKGQETWIDRYIRYKKDRKEYLNDIKKYNLTDTELSTIEKYVKDTLGLGVSQEQCMKILMDKDICDFSLKEANKARKTISKKKIKEIPALQEKVFAQAKSEGIANYIWDLVVAPQLSYSFSDIHSLSYSYIGFQSAYIATHWNSIYWNCACLIVNSGSIETNDDKDRGTSYDKIAVAIGKMRSAGINISLPDVNNSQFGFIPDVKNNRIYCGLKNLTNIGDDVVNTIIENRPYTSIKDFINKTHLNKSAMLSLIKGGAFDEFDDRIRLLTWYIWETCDKKKNLNLQNMKALMENDLLPHTDEIVSARKIYEFNRYLKAICKDKNDSIYYHLDDRAMNFMVSIDRDKYVEKDGNLSIKVWDRFYQKDMDVIRNWIADNKDKTLNELNYLIFKEAWDKYACEGNISRMEMETLCFYYHEHELAGVRNEVYGFSDFNKLPLTAPVERTFGNGGKIFKLTKICGTVIAKDKNRSTINLLTTSGVVNVKISKGIYAYYNKQISERISDGGKKILERSWFTRGTKLIIGGMRRDDEFVAKKYASQGGHEIMKINGIDKNGKLIIQSNRAQGEMEDEYEQ